MAIIEHYLYHIESKKKINNINNCTFLALDAVVPETLEIVAERR